MATILSSTLMSPQSRGYQNRLFRWSSSRYCGATVRQIDVGFLATCSISRRAKSCQVRPRSPHLSPLDERIIAGLLHTPYFDHFVIFFTISRSISPELRILGACIALGIGATLPRVIAEPRGRFSAFTLFLLHLPFIVRLL